jgi:hypothetical protein
MTSAYANELLAVPQRLAEDKHGGKLRVSLGDFAERRDGAGDGWRGLGHGAAALGPALRAGAAHVVQFRPIRVKWLRKSPHQFAEGIGEVSAHDALPSRFAVPHPLGWREFSAGRKGAALLQSFGEKSLKIGAKSR